MCALKRWVILALVFVLAVPTPAPAARSAPDAGTTERVSLTSESTQGNWGSSQSSVSADGRFVAFGSDALNLVAGDTNEYPDIFVRDRLNGTTERVSLASDGSQANSYSDTPSISAGGRFVAFNSDANNLVSGDTNDLGDVFVRDRLNGTTERVSLASDETQANLDSFNPSISADGRFVAFESGATNLVPDDPNLKNDIFVRDIVDGTTERVSAASDEAQGNHDNSFYPSISADGRFIAFMSWASNLVPGDTNGTDDIFVHDRLTGRTELVSLVSDETQTNGISFEPSISADGRFVAFVSMATNLAPGDTNGVRDVFVRDRLTGTTECISLASDETYGNSMSEHPSISGNGRFVSFESEAINLVPGDTNANKDIFVRDRLAGTTERVSLASDEAQGNSQSNYPSISGNGRFVVFESVATNLVPDDTNGSPDIFLHDRYPNGSRLYLPLARKP